MAHGPDLIGAEVELLGGDLRQRRRRALAELDEADEDGRGVVGVDGDPAVDLIAGWRARRRGRSGLAPSTFWRRTGEGEADDQRAAGLQQSAAVEGGRAHRRPPLIAPAARLIALTIRG